MMVVGILCNFFVAVVIGRINLLYLVCELSQIFITDVFSHINTTLCPVAGTTLTGCAGLLFAVIIPSSPYWAFGFPAASLSVFGADFVFACGTLFVAKVSTMDEQSVAGGLFQTLTQVEKKAVTSLYHSRF